MHAEVMTFPKGLFSDQGGLRSNNCVTQANCRRCLFTEYNRT